MKTPFVPTLACLALLVVCPLALRADSITFNWQATPANELVTSTNLSISQVNGLVGSVVDTKTGITHNLPSGSTIVISPITIGGGTFVVNPGISYVGQYFDSGTITIDSSACVGGAEPGVCLTGDANQGGYSGFVNDGHTGSFGGNFMPTYMSPYITGLFGDPTVTPAELALLNAGGSFDGYDSGHNAIVNSHKGTGEIQSGEVDEVYVPNSPIPEPDSLLIFGTGMLGLACVIFFRNRDSSRSNIHLT